MTVDTEAVLAEPVMEMGVMGKPDWLHAAKSRLKMNNNIKYLWFMGYLINYIIGVG
jgi:hypothetical protein